MGLGVARRSTGPAVAAAELGPIDAVLLTTTTTPTTSTTPGGHCCRPPVPCSPRCPARNGWAAMRTGSHLGDDPAAGADRPTVDVTATPCRHGPPGSRPITGDVIGFALGWDGQRHGVLWISGDTVLYDGVRQVADRLRSAPR